MSRAASQAFALTVSALLLGGCGGGGGEEAESEGGAETGAAASAPVQVADAATLNGKVTFAGTPPAARAIDMSEEKICADKHAGGAKTEEVVVGNGGLKNVFVYVKSGLPAQPWPTPSEAVTIDQNGCMYSPRVLGVQANQKLVIKNSDGILHNIKANPSTNRGFNISQPTTMESTRSFTSEEVMIPVECDVHGWMKAYIGVLNHPYFAVSADDGSFTIKNLPPGTYVLEAWHEKLGPQTANVTVGPNEAKDVQFSYNAQMAATAVVPLGTPIHLHGPAAHDASAHQHTTDGDGR